MADRSFHRFNGDVVEGACLSPELFSLGEDSAPVGQGTQAFEKALVRERAEAVEEPRHNGRGDGAAESPEQGSVKCGEWRQERDQEGTDARPRHNRDQAKAGIGWPAWTALVEGLDFGRPHLPNDTFEGRDDENELVSVKDGGMTVELFSRRQPNAEGMSRRSAACEVIGQRDVGRFSRGSHRGDREADD